MKVIQLEMSATEAKEFGIAVDERQRYYRLDAADAPRLPATKATWFRLIKVDLRSGTPDDPKGDEADAIERWYPPT